MAHGSNAAWTGWASCGICGGVGHADADCKFGVTGAHGPVARHSVCERAHAGAKDDSEDLSDGASRESEVKEVARGENSLRLGSVNVHSLHDPHKMARLLQPHTPFDALAIQESPHGSSERLHLFAALLGMQVCVIRPAAHHLENAILVPLSQASSSKKMEGAMTCHSGFYSQQADRRHQTKEAARTNQEASGDRGETRDYHSVTTSSVHGWDLETESMELRTAVAVELPQGVLVCCTHLCAYKEAARLSQLSQLIPKLQETARGRGVVMLGDFNSVRRADYSSRAWAELVNRRAQHGIFTETAVTSQLETAWGFRDCRAEAETVQGRVVTSRYEVRVDYAWADAAALAAWKVERVCHVDLEAATDHSLVVCDLRPRDDDKERAGP